jgi:hypothetical protein
MQLLPAKGRYLIVSIFTLHGKCRHQESPASYDVLLRTNLRRLARSAPRHLYEKEVARSVTPETYSRSPLDSESWSRI